MKKSNLNHLIAAIALFIVSNLPTQAFRVNGIYYVVTDEVERTCAVASSSESFDLYYSDTYSGDVTIPATVYYDGQRYTVTSIGAYAFVSCEKLTSVSIPNTVVTIDKDAFAHCSGLTSITIPNSVTEIGAYALYGCSKLTSLEIPNSVTEIGTYAFYECNELVSLKLSESLTTIRSSSISKLPKLKTIVIPNSVTTIESTFSDLPSLESIEIPESVTDINSSAFWYTSNLKSIKVSPDNPVYDSRNNCNAIIKSETNTLIKACVNSFIPNTVTTIGGFAFEGAAITSIIIPNSVNNIESHVFDNCEFLESIYIPSTVTSLSSALLKNCKSLKSFVIDKNNPVYDSRDNCNAIIKTADNELIAGFDISTIPNTVKKIGWYAFNECNFTSIEIPNSVEWIDVYAFDYCRNLTSLKIPSSVTYLSTPCQGCNALESITVDPGNQVYDSRNNCNAIIRTADNLLIQGCGGTIIPSGVEAIGRHAFDGNKKLTSIDIPNTVTTIGYFAFQSCTELKSVTIANSVKTIEVCAFDNCSSLESVNIPNSVTYLGMMAFGHCNSLKSVEIPNSVKYIQSTCFCQCPSLETVIIPNSVISIGSNAFSYCYKLKDINIPNSVTSIGSSAFFRCYDLKSAIIPNSVTSLGSYAYEYCTNLGTIVIPSSLTSIGSCAFNECPNVVSITNQSTVPQAIEKGTFRNYNATLHVPHNYAAEYKAADIWKNFNIVDDYIPENAVFTDDLYTKAGRTITVPIKMNNASDITAVQFDMQLPEGVTIAKDEKGKYMVKIAEDRKADDHILSFSYNESTGAYRVGILSMTNSSFEGNSGVIANVTFEVDEEMAPENYFITFKNEVLTTADMEYTKVNELRNLLEVEDYLEGDLNGDDEVNIVDAVAAVNLILNTKTEGINRHAADVNNDWEVTVADAVGIVNLFMYGQLTAPESKARNSRSFINPEVSAESVVISEGGVGTLYIQLNAPASFTGMQFDLKLPAGLTLVDNSVRSDAMHSVNIAPSAENSNRMVCYSVQNESFAVENIISLQIKADRDIISDELIGTIENIHLADSRAMDTQLPNMTFNVKIGATGVISVNKDYESEKVYDMTGRKIKSATANGIHIVNGKKQIKH